MYAHYRDDSAAARMRLETLLERWHGEQEASRPARAVYVRRWARIAFGSVALAVPLAMAVAHIGFYLATCLVGDERASGIVEGIKSLLLGETLLLALPLGSVAAVVAALVASSRHPGSLALSNHVAADIARLEARPAERMRDSANRLEKASIALPMMAIAMAAPLSIHFVTWLVHEGVEFSRALREFENWIRCSAILVGHAHVALAVGCYLFAREIRSYSDEELAVVKLPRGWKVLGIVTLVSAVPGVICLAIPPVLVFVTGAVFVPLMFSWMGRRAKAERAILAG